MTSTLDAAAPAVAIAQPDQYPHVSARPKKMDAFRYMQQPDAERTEHERVNAHEYARIYFTQGQCHALALAIADLTECTLMGLNWHGYYPDHVFVQLPSGLGLDICGLFEEGSHPDPLMCGEWKAMTRDEVHHLETYCYAEALLEIAQPFAQILVDWYV